MNSSMHQRVVHPSSGTDGFRLQIRQEGRVTQDSHRILVLHNTTVRWYSMLAETPSTY